MSFFWLFVVIFLALVIGFILGLLFAPNVKREITKLYAALVTFIIAEFAKIHGKLDALLAAVKLMADKK